MEKFLSISLTDHELDMIGYTNDQIYNTCSTFIEDYLAIDCEMVMTDLGLEVVKIGLYNEKNQSVYYIKYKGTKVIDYISNITNITEEELTLNYENKLITIDELTKIFNNKVIIGHHVTEDLKYLSIYHKHIIDTSLLFSHPDGFPYSLGILYC